MKPCVLYFSRTGNTKGMAEAISEATNTPVFAIASSDPSVVEDFDMLIVGTPVEGFRPARETTAFVERLPKTEGKKAIVFCTCALWKGRTFSILKKELSRLHRQHKQNKTITRKIAAIRVQRTRHTSRLQS
jgi:flavodoxin